MTKTRTIVCAVAMLVVLLVVGACSSGSSSTKGTTSGAGGGGGGSNSSYCSKIKNYTSKGFSSDPTGEKAINALRDVAKSAPSEIKSDLNYLVDTFEKFINLDTNDISAYQSIASSVDTAKIQDAEQHVQDYTEKHCGISLTS
jgi:hypothetical protein